VRRIVLDRDAGLRFDKIALALTTEGILSPAGRPSRQSPAVRRIYQSATAATVSAGDSMRRQLNSPSAFALVVVGVPLVLVGVAVLRVYPAVMLPVLAVGAAAGCSTPRHGATH
jgi:hypothetical protein